MKTVRNILFFTLIVLGIMVLVNQPYDQMEVLPYMLINLGVITMFTGIDFYKKDNKATANMMFLTGILVLIVSIFILFS